MKNEKMNEIKKELDIELEKWYTLYDIDSIDLKDGKGIYPNWKFLRFLFTENEIYVKHGKSEPYGGRLSTKFSISSSGMNILFPYGPIISPVNIHKDFRNPKKGDILVALDNDNTVVSECLISDVIYGLNGTSIILTNSINVKKDVFLTFYDPTIYSAENCIHSSIMSGVYLKFKENESISKHKKYGIYHEIIKNKNITGINLKLISKKTFVIK